MFKRFVARLLVFLITFTCALLVTSFFSGQALLLNEPARFSAIEEPHAPTPDGSQVSIRYIGLGPCLSYLSRRFEIVNNGFDSVYFSAIRNRHAYWAIEDSEQTSTTWIFRDAKTQLKLLPGHRAQLTLDVPERAKSLEFSYYYLVDNEILARHRSILLEGGNDIACG